jgi:hypothetical protein
MNLFRVRLPYLLFIRRLDTYDFYVRTIRIAMYTFPYFFWVPYVDPRSIMGGFRECLKFYTRSVLQGIHGGTHLT